MPHPDDGTLHALIDNELPALERAALETHFATCAECRARLAEARMWRGEALALVTSLDEEPGNATPERARVTSRPAIEATPRRAPSLRTFTGLAWAASILVAASAGYLARDVARGPEATLPFEPTTGRSAALADSGFPADRIAREATPPPSSERAERRALEPTGKARNTAAAADTASAAARTASDRPAAAEDRAPRPESPAEPARERQEAVRQPDSGSAPRAGQRRSAEAPAAETAPSGAALFRADQAKAAATRYRLIEALDVDAVEVVDSLVRIHYLTMYGRLVLEQWPLPDGRIRTRLVPPPGAPADSIAAWEARVR